jgi:hypothetical protein
MIMKSNMELGGKSIILYIIPSVFDQKVVELVRERVIQAAIRTNAARRIPSEFK